VRGKFKIHVYMQDSCVCVCMYICVCACMFVRVNVFKCACAYIRVYISMHVRTFGCMYNRHTETHTHENIHTARSKIQSQTHLCNTLQQTARLHHTADTQTHRYHPSLTHLSVYMCAICVCAHTATHYTHTHTRTHR